MKPPFDKEPRFIWGERKREPILNVPKSVSWLLYLLIGIHVVQIILPDTLRFGLLYMGGFIPQRVAEAFAPGGISVFGDYVLATFPFFSYNFLHADLIHLFFNSVWLLAFGGGVGRRLGGDVSGSYRFFLLFFISGIAGALMHMLFYPTGVIPLIGASAGVAGLMGAAARFIFLPMQLAAMKAPIYVPLTDFRLLAFSGIFIALNVAIGLFSFGEYTDGASIAWQAHIGGYLAGLLAFPLLDRRR